MTVAALVALLGYGVAQNEPDTSIDSAVAAGKRPSAPALDLPRLGAPGNLSLRALRGKVVLVNFWASWCPPCRSESPILNRWQRRIQSQNATVLGVDVLDVESDAVSFERRYKVAYPSVRDGDGHSRNDYDVHGQPETIIVDRRGRVAQTFRGPVTDADLQRVLPPLLREHA